VQYARDVQRLRFDLSRPFRPSQWITVAVVWMGIALTVAIQNHAIQTALRMPFTWGDSFRYPAVECLYWCLATPMLLWMVHRFDLFSARWPQRALLFIATNGVVTLVHAFYRTPLHYFVYAKMEWLPARTLLRYYLLGNLLNDIWIFWSIVGIAHLVLYLSRSADRERALVRAQMQALKSQLQPHFFFNALNSISSLMRDDVESADDMITRLSDLLRVSLKTDATQEIPLRQELQVVETYIQIEQMRFADRLKFNCQASEEALDARVPALILLPLIENSVQHGIALRSRPGEIRIVAGKSNGALSLEVFNEGPGNQSPIVEGIGLAGTRRRLQQHYGNDSMFSYERSNNGDMTVRIIMPFILDKETALHAHSRSDRG